MPCSQRGSCGRARMGPCCCQLCQSLAAALASGQHIVPHAAGVLQAYA